MTQSGEPHRGYTPYVEFGLYVWYRTTKSVAAGRQISTGKEMRAGTNMNRVPTIATDYETACKQLDNYLKKPKAVIEQKPPKLF